jgi:Arc/MetJ-type ribon-helix-helix transcriptional regulator
MNKKLKKRPEQEKFTTVSIPTPLFKKVKERIRETKFTSVSDYVIYVLREIVAEEEEEPEEPFTKKNEERVKARLRALGYIG